MLFRYHICHPKSNSNTIEHKDTVAITHETCSSFTVSHNVSSRGDTYIISQDFISHGDIDAEMCSNEDISDISGVGLPISVIVCLFD